MFRSKRESKNMALDFSSYENDCRSMGGLFQQLSHEMKNSSSVWQDFISKANKFHSALGVMLTTMTSFLDSFQKIADMANNSKGAVRDIGGALTKLCLRQRSVESKLKEYILILGGTFSPIPGLLDDWKKTVIQMDHSHAKEYKKLSNEIQKSLGEANKLRKQVEKGGRAEKLQPSLDSKIKAVEWKYSDLATNECVSLKKLTLHERQRYSFFVKCLAPLLEKQSEILSEASTLDEMKRILVEQTRDADLVIKYCEDFVDEFRAAKADPQQEQLTFVTPPGTPRCLTRHSSSLSIRSSSSALNQQRRPHSVVNKQEHGDGHSVISNSVSTTGAFETESMLSQDTLTKDHSTGTANNQATSSPGDDKGSADRSDIKTFPGDGFIPAPNSFTTFGSDRRSLTNSYDSLARKRQNKSGALPNSSDVEDAELLLAHRGDSNRLFNRGVSVRNTVSATSKNQAPVQPLDSPVRPGRKNDKRSTIGYPCDPRHNDFGLQKGQASFGSSGYATLGRNSFKTGSVKANFLGGNYSTGKIGNPMPSSPPPPPPLPPLTANHSLQSPGSTSEQVEVLIRSSSKKTSAPLPPTLTSPSSFPSSFTNESQALSSSFTYSPQYSIVSSTSQAPHSSGQNSGHQNSSKQRPNHTLNITIPYYTSQASDKSATPSSGKVTNSLATESAVGTSDKRSDSPTDIPIRILRKYPEGLITPPGTKTMNLEILAPPKPPPPLRNSSMAGEQTPPSSDSHPTRQLSRTNSFKQQSAPKDCPPLQKAAPLTIGDPSNNNGNSLDIKNNNNQSSRDHSPSNTSNRVKPSDF